MQRKKWLASLIGLSLCLSGGLVQAAAVVQGDADARRTEAVELARSGKYDESLAILDAMEKAGNQDQRFWADYLTILSWAGDNSQMVRLADAHYQGDFTSLPDYAALPLAQAYLKQGNEETGMRILDSLIQKGNKDAMLVKGERLLYDGHYKQADAFYEQLQTSGEIPAARLHYSQACAAMQRNDFVAAEKEFDAAKASVAPAEREAYVREVDAKRAALYIQHRESDKAAKILLPYVDSKQATPQMFSDYLIALRFDNKQAEAVKAFKAYGNDWSALPVYGIQNMADLYLRVGRYQEATKLYTYILTREDVDYVRLGRAYCLVQMGQENKALAEYKTVLEKYPARQDAVAGDGANFLSMGKISIARQLYSMLGRTPEEKASYQLQYAKALSDIDTDTGNPAINFRQAEALNGREYYHEAQAVFQSLVDNPEFSREAKAGMAGNKIKKGLFADGDKLLNDLMAEDATDGTVYEASMANERKKKSQLNAFFDTGVDYRHDRTEDSGLRYQQYLDGNFYIFGGLDHYSLHDDETRASYNRQQIGGSYHFDRGQVDLGYSRYSGGASINSLTLDMLYEFNDVATLGFSMGRRPHETAGAVQAGIQERYYTVRWDQILSDRWQAGLEYGWSSLDDGNRYRSYGLNGAYRLSLRNAYRDSLLFNFNRSTYDHTSDVYDSPARHIDYAVGFSRKWNIPRKVRTWEWITMLGWEHDNNDGNAFSPMTRLEFTQSIHEDQRVVAGLEYSWHKRNIDDVGTDNRSNGYTFDLNYYWEW